MEDLLSGFLMNSRKKIILYIFTVILGAGMLFLVTFHQTIYGILMEKVLPWEEDSYKGKPLAELRNSLTKKGIGLVTVDSGSLYTSTGRHLQSNEGALLFIKGSYRWFWLGRADIVGYVVFEKEGEYERILDIFHRGSVDSL
jgi:hypothetical protein